MVFRCLGKWIISLEANTLIQGKLIASRCLYAVHRPNMTICSKSTLLIKHNFICLKHNRLLTTITDEILKKKQKREDAKLTLISLLGLTEGQAVEILYQYPAFKQLSPEQITANYNYLLNNSYTKEYLSKYPAYLTHDEKNVEIRKELIKQSKIPEIYEYLFFQVPQNTFSDIYSHSKIIDSLYKPNIFFYFQNLLQCSLEDSIKALLKAKCLWTKIPQRIEENVNLLLEKGVSKQNLLQDPAVICSGQNSIRSRLGGLKEVVPSNRLKAWLIHCRTSYYSRHVEKSKTIKNLLGDGTIEDYVAKILNCSTDQAKEIFIKHRYIKNISPFKVQAVVKYIIMKGYTTQDILITPRIFAAKIASVDKKLLELEKLGMRPKTLYTLCLSNKDFRSYVNKIKANIKDEQ